MFRSARPRSRPAPLPVALALIAGLAPAACGKRQAAAPARPAAAEVVVARVEGAPITASDVSREAAARGLIAPGAALPRTDAAFPRLLGELVNQRLLAAEAERRKLTDDPAVARAVAAAQERALADALVADEVRRAASEAQIRALYQEQLRAGGGSSGGPPPTLEQARPQIVRFLTYDEVRSLLETLRGRAKIEITPDAGAAPAAPPPAPGAAGPAATPAAPAPAAPVLRPSPAPSSPEPKA